MMIKKSKRKLNKITLSLCFALFIFITFISIDTLSKYIVKVTDDDVVELVIMASDQIVTAEVPLKICPSETVDIPFNLTNEDKKGNVSEVSQSYTIDVTNIENNIPLTWKLYSNNQEVSYSDSFNANEKETKEYCLKVTWPSQYNDSDLSSEIDILEIRIVTEQLD